ncbi:MAG: hypothetical protein OEL78_08745 [Hyphomicrobiales bacterium]|nr:hypothetical protein [Hyphomicrobiales bacterium]
MAWSRKRKPALSDDLKILLDDLCTQWGFCNHLTAEDLISERQGLTAEAFARAVLRAEGMNPEHEIEWMRRIRAKFIERYGSSVSVKTHKQIDDADR